MNGTKRIYQPPQTTLHGKIQGDKMRVIKGGKAPKRNFSPGQFVKLDNQLYEIVYMFRIQEKPSEWLYTLEERKNYRSVQPTDKMGNMLLSFGCGSDTPRVMFDIFYSEFDAYHYFGDIISNGDRVTRSNQQMLKAKIVSSGEIL